MRTEADAALDREPMVTGEDARAVLEVIFAAYESAGTGRKVELPFSAEGVQINSTSDAPNRSYSFDIDLQFTRIEEAEDAGEGGGEAGKALRELLEAIPARDGDVARFHVGLKPDGSAPAAEWRSP